MFENLNNHWTHQHPTLLKEWDFNLNKDIEPKQTTNGSHRKFWWTCSKNHSYLCNIPNRMQGKGCPFCAGRKVLKGFNDLYSTNPFLANQWNYEKNKNITPYEVTAGSGKSVWWKCSQCQHEWVQTICNRSKGKGCPNCSKNGTSFPEQAIFYYLKQYFADVYNRDKSLGVELDVYIPSINTAIEYDGIYFHNNDNAFTRDNQKDEKCKSLGIQLYRFRDPKLKRTTHAKIIMCREGFNKDLTEGIKKLFTYLGLNSHSIDIDKDYYKIINESLKYQEEQSIVYTNPDWLKEWDYEKNYPIEPIKVTNGMGISIWWKCAICNNNYKMVLYAKKRGSACPICAVEKRSKNHSKTSAMKNNFFNKNPQLVKEWNFKKNTTTDIYSLSSHSGAKVWWKCIKCNYEWEATIDHRVNGNGCPQCSKISSAKLNCRKVLNIDTGIIYESLKDAANSCGGDKRNIYNCCSGRTHKAYGYRWKYAEKTKRVSRPTGNIKNLETGEIFNSIIDAARKYNCDRSSISKHLRGKTKSAVGYHWIFVE